MPQTNELVNNQKTNRRKTKTRAPHFFARTMFKKQKGPSRAFGQAAESKILYMCNQGVESTPFSYFVLFLFIRLKRNRQQTSMLKLEHAHDHGHDPCFSWEQASLVGSEPSAVQHLDLAQLLACEAHPIAHVKAPTSDDPCDSCIPYIWQPVTSISSSTRLALAQLGRSTQNPFASCTLSLISTLSCDRNWIADM